MTPVAPSARYKPTRAGLLNLFEYTNQVFEFSDGHLLLRGHNGAGKSKALELLLPFVLDGDTHPTKLDPFATTARQMRWNLILDDRHESRWGYAWVEFARQGDAGDPEYVTLIVGVRAHRQTQHVDTWFVVLQARRLGHEVSLINETSGAPHPRRGLAEALGEGAQVFDAATEFRSHVNEVLFGFQTVERYETMLELQRQLRRPHLSRSLDPHKLSDILTRALPEVDGQLVAEIGIQLDDIERLRQELRALSDVRAGFEAFTKTYSAYAKAVVRERGDAVVSVDRDRRAADERLGSKRTAATDAAEQLGALAERVEELERTRRQDAGAKEELLASDAMRSAQELRTMESSIERDEGTLKDFANSVESAASENEDAKADAESAKTNAAAAASRRDAVEGELSELAAIAGLAQHETLAERMRDADRPEGVAQTMRSAAATRRSAVDTQDGLRGNAETKRQRAQLRGDAAGEAERVASGAQERFGLAEQQLVAAREELVRAVDEWFDVLTVLVPSEAEHAALLDAAAASGDENRAPLRGRLDERIKDQTGQLARAMLAVDAQRDALTEERSPLLEEQRQLHAHKEREPERPRTRHSSREHRPGGPFWRLVDFAEGLPEQERAGLEGALEGAGLLDAWVTPDGRVLDVDGDIVLTADTPVRGRSLTAALVAAEQDAVEAGTVDGVLAAVSLGEFGGSSCGVAVDGRFRLGPAFGQFTKPAAQFVGAAARDAERLRRLGELAEMLAEMQSRDDEFVRRRDELVLQQETLDTELSLLPAETDTRSAFRELRDAERVLGQENERARSARALADTAAEDASHARLAAIDHARHHELPVPGARPELGAVRQALGDYRSSVDRLVVSTERIREHVTAAQRASERAERADAWRKGLAERHTRLAEDLDGRRGALRALRESVGDSALEAVDRLKALTASINAVASELRGVSEEKDELVRSEATLAVEIRTDEAELERLTDTLTTALARFRRLERHDVVRLALDDRAPSPGDLATWEAPGVGKLMRASQQALRTDASLEALSKRVEHEYVELHAALDRGVGLHPFRESEDGVTVFGVRRAGTDQSLRVLLQSLDEEIDAQRRNLTEQDEVAFERFLFGGLAQHLRARISGARRLVEETNDAITRCKTSSGIGIELDWEATVDDDKLLRRALRLLRQAPETLSDAERGQLIAFFRERVEAAREAQQEGTTAQHLLDALDYRDWHRFRVLQRKDGKKVPLTKKQHEQGSGGEKSAALHLPLFAAAAAHMRSAAAHAPRLIMLDEAFAGIDGTMRPQLLGLIEEFDLDFMLTSHELWCCERELEHLSIYQLHREEGVPGVATAHFLWDGAAGVRQEVDDAEAVAA